MLHIRNALKLFAFCIIWLIIFIGCGDDKKTPVAPQNSPPKITNISVSQNILDWGQSSKLKATVEDANGQTLTYNWHSNGGEFMSATNADSAIWKAPDSTASFQIFLTVSDGEETDSDTINISVMENPILGLMNVDTLTFFARKNIASFYVYNIGTGVLDWSVVLPTTPWIKKITPESGSTATNNETRVDIEIDRTGLLGGIHSEQLIINSSDDGSANLQLKLHVAELSFGPTTLDFGSTLSTLSFFITNKGSDTLDWAITPDSSGLITNITPNTGFTTTETDPVTVTISREGFPPGNYNGELNIASNGGNATIDVIMEVAGFPPSVFLDDFSGGLSQWLILSGQALTNNGFLELTGIGSNAGMTHNLNTTQQAPWLYRSDYGRKNNSSGGLSILWMSTNDVGTISITSYRFDIFSSGGNNWAAGAFIQTSTTSQWALLESNSIGFAPEINGNAGGLNDISWAITASKRIKIYVDGNLFYESNVLNELGTIISVGLESVGFISTTSQTTRADWALVRNVDDPGGAHELIMPSTSRTREVITNPIDLDQLDTKIQLNEQPYWQKPVTLKQVLEKIRKNKK